MVIFDSVGVTAECNMIIFNNHIYRTKNVNNSDYPKDWHIICSDMQGENEVVLSQQPILEDVKFSIFDDRLYYHGVEGGDTYMIDLKTNKESNIPNGRTLEFLFMDDQYWVYKDSMGDKIYRSEPQFLEETVYNWNIDSTQKVIVDGKEIFYVDDQNILHGISIDKNEKLHTVDVSKIAEGYTMLYVKDKYLYVLTMGAMTNVDVCKLDDLKEIKHYSAETPYLPTDVVDPEIYEVLNEKVYFTFSYNWCVDEFDLEKQTIRNIVTKYFPE